MNTEMVVLPAFFGMTSFVIWAVINGWLRRQHSRVMTEFNARLLDRMVSMKEFNDFLQTEGGARLLDALTADRATDPRDRIQSSTQAGIVFASLGIALLFLAWRHTLAAHEALTVVGVLALALGVGFLLSSVASYWLARKLRGLDVDRPRN